MPEECPRRLEGREGRREREGRILTASKTGQQLHNISRTAKERRGIRGAESGRQLSPPICFSPSDVESGIHVLSEKPIITQYQLVHTPDKRAGVKQLPFTSGGGLVG